MAGMSTSALLGLNVRPSTSAEVDLLGRFEQQRGCSLGGLPNQVALSRGGAAGLEATEQSTELLLGTHRAWVFSEPDGCCFRVKIASPHRASTCPFPPSPCLACSNNEGHSGEDKRLEAFSCFFNPCILKGGLSLLIGFIHILVHLSF